ncbi:photosystem II S4 domain protein [Clostridia bacterium]|nr:photosystem II S4 domain protein [Clostridia bacterium]
MRADREGEDRLSELAQRAARTGIAQFSGFLSPAQQAQAEISARKAGTRFAAWGGADGAERCVCAFAPGDDPAWPIACLRVRWHAKYGTAGHRDLLGAILALGVERDTVGDIYPGDGEAHVFALDDMARYLQVNLERAGSVPVRVDIADEPPALARTVGTAVRATVASVRLDAIVGAAWNLSRTRAAELVAAGRVQVDHQVSLRPDLKLQPGAVLSARGLGRAELAEIGGKTKKDRISVTLLRY